MWVSIYNPSPEIVQPRVSKTHVAHNQETRSQCAHMPVHNLMAKTTPIRPHREVVVAAIPGVAAGKSGCASDWKKGISFLQNYVVSFNKKTYISPNRNPFWNPFRSQSWNPT
jgi:hypothetical protein